MSLPDFDLTSSLSDDYSEMGKSGQSFETTEQMEESPVVDKTKMVSTGTVTEVTK
jgi:hypothetical protein